MMRDEFARRHSNTMKVLALFKSAPLQWINASELMTVAGALAWRTRVSDARKMVQMEGGTIDNRQRSVRRPRIDGTASCQIVSEYRYTPTPTDARAGIRATATAAQSPLNLNGRAL